MHFLWMLVGLMLVWCHCALCVFSQLTHFLLNQWWHWCNQEFLLWLYVWLVFYDPFPKLFSRKPVLRVELHQIAHNAPENLWVVLWVLPSVNQISSCSLVESKSLQLINSWRVLENSCSNYCKSNWENFWPFVFFIVTGSQLQLGHIFWGQKSHFLVNWFLVIGVFVGVRVKRSNLNLSLKIDKDIFRSDITNSLADFTDFMTGTDQTVQEVPKIRFPESLLFLLSVGDFLREQVREVIVVNLRME